jgi:hypothetical protein
MKTLWLVFLAKVLDYQFTASLFKKTPGLSGT